MLRPWIGDLQKKHKSLHTGENPFTCYVFKKAFDRTGILQTYERIHTGEKPFNVMLNHFNSLQTHNAFLPTGHFVINVRGQTLYKHSWMKAYIYKKMFVYNVRGQTLYKPSWS